MEEENALPHGWENMSYEEFLKERCKLMSAKIKQAFEIKAVEGTVSEWPGNVVMFLQRHEVREEDV